jgi:hypothetical protein
MLRHKTSTAVPNLNDFGKRSVRKTHSHMNPDNYISTPDPYDSFHSCNNPSPCSTESYQTASPSSSMRTNPSSPVSNPR